jgi:nitrite reductase (NADH) large subunit
MAKCVASTLCGKPKEFLGADMSTKLKLMGVEVGSFGNLFKFLVLILILLMF